MCWNADVSLNTFLFSCLALGFVYYTNTYTKYKTPLFDNPIAYVAFMSFVGMQLVEYFLWRNLKNREWNRLFSTIGIILLHLQPVFFTLLVPSIRIRNALLYTYGVVFIIHIYMYFVSSAKLPYTTVIDGHLSWRFPHFVLFKKIFYEYLMYLSSSVWLFILLYSVYITEFPLFLFVSVILLYSLYRYYNTGTWGSIWCWLINAYMLWLVFRILIVLPYYEYSGLC